MKPKMLVFNLLVQKQFFVLEKHRYCHQWKKINSFVDTYLLKPNIIDVGK